MSSWLEMEVERSHFQVKCYDFSPHGFSKAGLKRLDTNQCPLPRILTVLRVLVGACVN